MKNMAKRCVLVTGGAGFIASHIVDRLLGSGNKVIVVDDLSAGRRENINPKAQFYKGDVSDCDFLEPIFDKHKIDYIIHQAAKINLNIMLEDPRKDVNSSILSTINLLECCIDYKIKKFIYASSVAVYGRPQKIPVIETTELKPIYSYGISKKSAEDYIRYYSENYGINYSILRYGNVYGPRQPIYGEVGVIAIFTDRFITKKPFVIYGDGAHLRDYVFVDDVVEATISAITHGDRETFNVGCGIGTSTNTIFSIFNTLAHHVIKVVHKPERRGELGNFYCDTNKIKRILRWKAHTNLNDGICKTVDYYQHRVR